MGFFLVNVNVIVLLFYVSVEKLADLSGFNGTSNKSPIWTISWQHVNTYELFIMSDSGQSQSDGIMASNNYDSTTVRLTLKKNQTQLLKLSPVLFQEISIFFIWCGDYGGKIQWASLSMLGRRFCSTGNRRRWGEAWVNLVKLICGSQIRFSNPTWYLINSLNKQTDVSSLHVLTGGPVKPPHPWSAAASPQGKSGVELITVILWSEEPTKHYGTWCNLVLRWSGQLVTGGATDKLQQLCETVEEAGAIFGHLWSQVGKLWSWPQGKWEQLPVALHLLNISCFLTPFNLIAFCLLMQIWRLTFLLL